MRVVVGGGRTEERQNRVEVRRGRELDLTARRGSGVGRDDPAQHLELDGPQRVFVVFVEVAPLGEQALHPRVDGGDIRVHPGQLLPDLQIAQRREIEGPLPRLQPPEFGVARVRVDHRGRMRVEPLTDEPLGLGAVEGVGLAQPEHQLPVPRPFLRVGLDLLDE
jgi:hypothetical protein